MASDSPIRLERDGGVAKLTLTRPEAANALNMPMAHALMRAAIELDEDESVRAVLLTGEGKMFCAGGDLGAMDEAGKAGKPDEVGDRTAAYLKELTVYLHAAISRFARMRAPVVTAVNGTAAGAGFSMMVATDMAIASETAKFTMAYTGAGIVTGWEFELFPAENHWPTANARIDDDESRVELGRSARLGARKPGRAARGVGEGG